MNFDRKPCGRILFFLFVSTYLAPGLAGDGDTNGPPKSNSVRNVTLIFLATLVVLGVAIILYKKWQKKKREEQHARLLKLFEEDDDLEAEMGLRDEF
ncbi:hypothetical protein SUGI_0296400 [Cryptomeria japonica]|uniref:uncharacterized protein LOC131066988 n=1 Tax=Cryptomeria japonica TaxID=3369 RepID=UPI002408B2C8|nr:uncharacterized protein LOC131066988 [Cryptomeria japonica]GLJ17129.1 hypothetical protein SUGI_0296400 [Cryptomeria japonica]